MRGLKNILLGIAIVQLLYALFVLIGVIVVLASGDVPRIVTPPDPSLLGGGFTGGFCHGFLGVWNVLQILLGDPRPIYQAANEGFWYNLGYLGGGAAFVSLVQLPEAVISIATGTGSSIKSTMQSNDDESDGLSNAAFGVIALITAIVIFIIAPGDAWQPLAAATPIPTTDLGWFTGLMHGQMSGALFSASWFYDDVTIYQAAGSDAYNIGFRLPGLFLCVVSLLKALTLLVFKK